MNKAKTTPAPHKCHDCGSDLILIEEKTITLGNNLYPITISNYRCSNKECQDVADKRTAKKLELRQEQEQARAKRIEENLKLKDRR